MALAFQYMEGDGPDRFCLCGRHYCFCDNCLGNSLAVRATRPRGRENSQKCHVQRTTFAI